MLSGRFPVRSPSELAAPYTKGGWSSADLDPDRRPRVGRRQWMVGLGCLLAGAALPSSLRLVTGRAAPGEADGAGEAAVLPDWAREMLDAPADELIERAGEFEMQSARHRGEARLAPCFERLLRISVGSAQPHRDLAAACAVRSLARLGRIDLVESWLPRIRRDPGLGATEAAAREEIEEAALYRRSRKR